MDCNLHSKHTRGRSIVGLHLYWLFRWYVALLIVQQPHKTMELYLGLMFGRVALLWVNKKVSDAPIYTLLNSQTDITPFR